MDIQDFDEWSALARTNPDAFEARRRAVLEAFIAAAPAESQQRLRGLQFRVDLERQRATNPLSATIRISNMMWSAFGELRDALDRSVNGDPSPSSQADQRVRTAEVIPLRPR